MSTRVKKAAAGAGLLGCAFLLLLFIYLQFNVGIPCVFYHITGLYCPGCGTMRALVSLTQLRVHEALHYNAYLFILAPFLLAEAIRTLVAYIRGKPTKVPARYSKIYSAVMIVLLVGFILFGIARNIPAFSFLAPL